MPKNIFRVLKDYIWILLLILLVAFYLELNNDNKRIKYEVKRLHDEKWVVRKNINDLKKQISILEKQVNEKANIK